MSLSVERKNPKVRKVWMFSYESAGIAQAGGLGEAVSGLARTLSSDYGLKVTVFLPSHGRHLDPDIRKSFNLTEDTKFIANGYRVGVNGIRYNFLSGIETGGQEHVDIALVKGLDEPTSHWLDNPVLYDHDVVFEKMALFSRTVKLYAEYLLSMNRHLELPDIIHGHDWHMVPASVATKQYLGKRGVPIPFFYTVHLLSGITLPWHYASEEWCGIENLTQKIAISKWRMSIMSYRQIWEGPARNSLETFGCLEADYVSSVSQSYLSHDVLEYVGRDAISGKSGHIYNGCDWSFDTINSTVRAERREHGTDSGMKLNRWDIRTFLLTRGIAEVAGEKKPEDNDGPLAADAALTSYEPFRTDGPLVLMTGRLSPQKGADLLLEAVPLVTEKIPETRFLFFLLPSNGADVNVLEKTASGYTDNVRLIFGKHPETYLMAHVAGDVYAMPSRFEPFGISALEAMATGNPVVGSDTGGIRETVLDINDSKEAGTGLLFPVEDVKSLADSLTSLILLMWIGERTMKGQANLEDLAKRIPSRIVADLVRHDPLLSSRIRNNSISRIDNHFRWKNAGEMAIARYTTATALATRSGRRAKPAR